MNIEIVKGIYQYFKIKLRLLKALLSLNNLTRKELLNKTLAKRGYRFNPQKKVRFFVIMSINNWERGLINAIKSTFSTFHFTWDNVESFFNSKDQWEIFYQDLNQRLIKEFEDFYLEDVESNTVIFLYSSDFCIDSHIINKLKYKNVFVVSFCWDDLLYFTGEVKGQPVGIKMLSKVADLNLTFSPEAIVQYRANKALCFFWDYTNRSSTIERLSSNSVSNFNESDNFYVLFVGTCYGYRKYLIERIKQAGITVKCYGKGWENASSLSYERLIEEVVKAPVTLGVSFVGYTKSITTLKGRDFEVPLWGGCYLTQKSEGIQRYYEDGKDLILYNNFSDCIDKIKFLRANPNIRKQIRYNAFMKAQHAAKWENKIFKIIEYLEVYGKENTY